MIVRVKQLVKRLSDSDDREEQPAGSEGLGSTKDYPVDAMDEEAALDEFHHTIPIGCLEDFEITVLSDDETPTEEDVPTPRAALGCLLDQVRQMQGMFPDEDGQIAAAVANAEAALNSSATIHVAVYCSGGVVNGVSTDADCDVEVLVCDYDDAGDMEGEFADSDERSAAYESSLSFPDGTSFDDFALNATVVY